MVGELIKFWISGLRFWALMASLLAILWGKIVGLNKDLGPVLARRKSLGVKILVARMSFAWIKKACILEILLN